MKKSMLFLLLCLLMVSGIIFCFVYDKITHRTQREANNPNQVSLINKSNLETTDISILWSCGNKELVLYKHGEYLNPKFKEYGHNHFKLYYKDSLFAHFGQKKHNNWHGHHYIFTIEKDQNISLAAEGPDAKRIYKID